MAKRTKNEPAAARRGGAKRSAAQAQAGKQRGGLRWLPAFALLIGVAGTAGWYLGRGMELDPARWVDTDRLWPAARAESNAPDATAGGSPEDARPDNTPRTSSRQDVDTSPADLRRARARVAELERHVAELERTVEHKDARIADLTIQLKLLREGSRTAD